MALPPPASLVPLLRSNDAPLAPQKLLVEEILRDKQAELSALGDEIAQLERTLWSLRKKHADLGAEVTQYSSILSPIRNFPPEVIGDIFLYFAPSMAYRHLTREVIIHKVELPWKLAHICRRWRSISLSLGQLWPLLDLGPLRSYAYSRFVARPWDEWDEEFTELLPEFADIGESDPIVPLPSPEVNRPWYYEPPETEEEQGFEIAMTLDCIDGYLQRFGNRPLSFRLWPCKFAVPTLWAALLKHSALWQEIVLCSLKFRGGLQGLCQIGIVSTHFPYQVAPNLTDLTLMRITICPVDESCIPWSQLTRYCEIGCNWPGGGERRLGSYQKLTNLRILRMKLSEYRFLETDTPLILPNLRAATLDFLLCIRSHTTKLIQSFDMPALEDLTIQYGDALVDPLPFLVPRSSPKLKFFRARAYTTFPSADPDHLVRTLELFPDLEEIMIDIPHLITNTAVSRLIPSPHELPLLGPKLGTIRFSDWSFVDGSCEWRTLVGMLQARFRPTVPGITRLQTFEFSTEFSNDVNVTSGLKALRVRNNWDIRVGNECSLPPWEKPDSYTA
ncbi:hypothetical protein B0H14DRAFT_2716188 [Mycena olivaceomarginata]|nr:hypothetical protein B0H14DRAFT_2716188 [Mycena olivaceomarginata]